MADHTRLLAVDRRRRRSARRRRGRRQRLGRRRGARHGLEDRPAIQRCHSVVRVGNAPRALASDGGGSGSRSPPAAGIRRSTPRVPRAAPSRRPPAAASSRARARHPAAPDRVRPTAAPSDIGTIPDAIAFVLRRHDFRAGRFRVGYQSCDDSTAKQGAFEPREVPSQRRPVRPDAARRRHRRALQLRLHRRAARDHEPRAGRAAGHDLADEHGARAHQAPVPGAPAGRLAKLYPTGRRHYVRLLGCR